MPVFQVRSSNMRWGAALLAVLWVAALPSSATAAPIGDSSAEKQEKVLDVLETFVPRAEQFWCLNASPGPFCNTDLENDDSSGYFDTAGLLNARGEGAIVYIYATLLSGRPTQSSFAGISRSTMETHLHQGIRHLAFSHVSKVDPGEDQWGGPPYHVTNSTFWQGSWGAFQMMYAAQQQWSLLSSTTRQAVKDVVGAHGDDLLNPDWPEQGTGDDTKAEENAWNAAGIAAAAGLMPTDGRAGDWDYMAKALAINSSTLPNDETSSDMIDGTLLSTWASTVALEDDYTVTNHGFFHPVYSWGSQVSILDAMVIYAGSSLSMPDAFMFRVEEIWDNVMAHLATDDGDFVLPAGAEWPTHDYSHAAYFGMIATQLGRADASVQESRAIDQFVARSAATLSIPRVADEKFAFEADVYRNIALDWWVHELFGPAPEPDQAAYDAARATSDGVKWFTSQDSVFTRNVAGDSASMSWDFASGGTWPTGLVVPSNANFLSDPAFVKSWPTSGVDGANQSVSSFGCDCQDGSEAGYFSTAAIINSSPVRKFSMSAFSDGSAILLDRGSGATASFGFEDLAGFTGSRTVRSDSGPGVEGNLAGSWANIGNRFGLVVKGGSGLWADQGDQGQGQPPVWLRGSLGLAGDSGHRGAAVFPNVTGSVTDGLEPDVRQPTVSDSNWSALTAIAPNGTGKFAVARWGGSGTATVSNMSSSAGVPIPDLPFPVTVTGTSTSATGSMSWTLASPYSRGANAFWFVTAENAKTVTVTPISETRIRLVNGGSSNSVTVKYDGGLGSLQTDTLTLPANTTAIATLYNGAPEIIVMTASSTEPPGTSAPWLALDGSTGGTSYWVSDGTTLSTTPVCLTIDLGSSKTVGRVTLVSRSGFGPKDYTVHTRTDAPGTCGSTTGWGTAKATVTNASNDNTPKVHTWTPASARYIRVRVTAAWGSGPPFYVQIRELTPAAS
jgi:NedA-like, galactose-binding domain